jgi:hypothetical protein
MDALRLLKFLKSARETALKGDPYRDYSCARKELCAEQKRPIRWG